MTKTETQDQARRLMRAGLSDEAIEVKTGLNPLDILELRASAAVEEAARRPKHGAKSEPRASDA